jgi:hypothetical protein
MYTIAPLVGFGTYLWLSPLVVWVAVFTLMPLVSAFLIYCYLRKFSFSHSRSGL